VRALPPPSAPGNRIPTFLRSHRCHKEGVITDDHPLGVDDTRLPQAKLMRELLGRVNRRVCEPRVASVRLDTGHVDN
jgi:hypothetical protein